MSPKNLVTAALIVFVAAILPAAAAAAQPEALTYFERSLGAGAATSLDLGREELAAMAEGLAESSPELAELLGVIDSARMRRFELAPDMGGAALASFADAAAELREGGWLNLVSVKDGDSRVEIFLDFRGEVIHGLAALFAAADEAGYASVSGRVEMAQIMALTKDLQGLPQTLDHLGKSLVQDQ